jgi:TM2 domain-containing membrane protein YozV
MAELGIAELTQMTAHLDDNKKMIFNQQYMSEKKDSGITIILALFCFDRFWLGDIGLGIIKYLTAGGCGIWWLIDLFTAKSRTDAYNRAKAAEIMASIQLMH